MALMSSDFFHNIQNVNSHIFVIFSFYKYKTGYTNKETDFREETLLVCGTNIKLNLRPMAKFPPKAFWNGGVGGE